LKCFYFCHTEFFSAHRNSTMGAGAYACTAVYTFVLVNHHNILSCECFCRADLYTAVTAVLFAPTATINTLPILPAAFLIVDCNSHISSPSSKIKMGPMGHSLKLRFYYSQSVALTLNPRPPALLEPMFRQSEKLHETLSYKTGAPPD